MLGFEAKRRPPAVYEAAFSGQLAVEEVARVELHSRFGGVYLEDASGGRIVRPRRECDLSEPETSLTLLPEGKLT